MTLTLDPRRPIVWRTPHSLQIGVDPVLVRLDTVSDSDLRLIDALAVGITREGLHTLATHVGVSPNRVEELIRRLAPALASTELATSVAATVVVGAGMGANRIATMLREAGRTVTLMAPPANDTPMTRRGRRPGAALLVSSHVIDPREHQRWLRRDVPHLPIVFGEVAVSIGPLVVPGTSACLGCVERRRTVDDPARTAIATQLWGATAAGETAALATEAAVEAQRLLRSTTTGRSVRIDGDTGERTETVWRADDECGCLGLSPQRARAPRQESGSAGARRGPWSPAAPTKARAPFVPA